MKSTYKQNTEDLMVVTDQNVNISCQQRKSDKTLTEARTWRVVKSLFYSAESENIV